MYSRAQHHHHFALGEGIKNEAQGRGRVSRNMHIMLQRHAPVRRRSFPSLLFWHTRELLMPDSSGRDDRNVARRLSAFTLSAVGANSSSRGKGRWDR